MNKKLSVSEVAVELCTKIGIKVYTGDGGFTINGVEFNEYLELDAEPPEYKGYRTIPKISILDGVFYGKIAAIKDLVTWQSDTVEGITKEFHSCVDDYLDFCKEIGKEPEKPEVK